MEKLRHFFIEKLAKFIYPLLVGAFALLPLILSAVVLGLIEAEYWQLDTTSFSHLILFFVGMSVSMGMVLLPTTFVAILSGYYWGWLGLFGVLLSYPLAALIGLYLGKFVFRKTGQDLLKNDRYKKILEQLEKGPLAMLIFARLSPVLPFGMTNILLGQLELKAGMYLLGTMIGMLPRTLFFFFLGTQAQEIIYLLQHPNESSTGQIMTLFFLLISVGGLFWVGMRVWKRSFNS